MEYGVNSQTAGSGEYAYGGNGNDTLMGDVRSDHLEGNGGSDSLYGGDGDDTLIGDCISYETWFCRGPDYDANEYSEPGAADTIEGGAGNDVIVGGAGSDHLWGGSGSDVFVFEHTESFGDIIYDFEAGTSGDKLFLNHLFFESTVTNDSFQDRIRFTQSGADVLFEVDLDGTGVTNNFVAVSTLKNISSSSLTESNVFIGDTLSSLVRPVYFANGSLCSDSKVTITTSTQIHAAEIVAGKIVIPKNIAAAEPFSLTSDESTTGAVGISDVIRQLRHIVGLDTLTGLSFAAGDNDSSGDISISDVITSLRTIVGLQDPAVAKLVGDDGDDVFTADTLSAQLYSIATGDTDLSWSLPDIV